MELYPAIDLYKGAAVRLFKGDYSQMTIYDKVPLNTAKRFENCGASFLHIVDLEGAQSGNTSNIKTIEDIVTNTNLVVEVGGGIRDMNTIDTYLKIGVKRVILGTAAITNKDLLQEALSVYGDRIAVGADIKDGKIAIKGWAELSNYTCDDFFTHIEELGVKTVICTDISRDGTMTGANHGLYSTLSKKFKINVIASGGISSMEDIIFLNKMNLYGAILGKSLYTNAINLSNALDYCNSNKNKVNSAVALANTKL